MKILGLSINSRKISLAILHKDVLLDSKVRLFRGTWSPDKQQRMLECIRSCIEGYKVSRVAIALLKPHQRNSETEGLYDHVKAMCSDKNILVSTFLPKALHYFCIQDRPSKKHMMEAIANYYPELMMLYRKEILNRSKYYYKLFEAVGVATLLARNIEVH
jgi:hypothetical protein